eukprot:1184025-Rhodomonas_salina.1
MSRLTTCIGLLVRCIHACLIHHHHHRHHHHHHQNDSLRHSDPVLAAQLAAPFNFQRLSPPLGECSESLTPPMYYIPPAVSPPLSLSLLISNPPLLPRPFAPPLSPVPLPSPLSLSHHLAPFSPLTISLLRFLPLPLSAHCCFSSSCAASNSSSVCASLVWYISTSDTICSH